MTEQEEKDLREKLDKEIPNGAYNIGIEGMVCWTGKGGRIDFEIAMIKALETHKVKYKNKKV